MGKLNAEQIAAARRIAAAQQRRAAGGPYTRTELPPVTTPQGAEPWYTERRHPAPVIVDVYTGPDDVPQQMGRLSRRTSGLPDAYVIEIED